MAAAPRARVFMLVAGSQARRGSIALPAREARENSVASSIGRPCGRRSIRAEPVRRLSDVVTQTRHPSVLFDLFGRR